MPGTFRPPLNRWHYDPAAQDVKCSFCGKVRLADEAQWTSCDDIGERHPTQVTYDICADCVQSIDRAVEEVLNGTTADAPVDDDQLRP